MAEFHWLEGPSHGVCNACGASVCARGFVDMIGTVNVVRDGYEISGIVDVIYCGDCLEQASRYVGCASRTEVEGFAQREYDLMTELEKVKDEAKAWQERFEKLERVTFFEDVAESDNKPAAPKKSEKV